MRQPVQHMRGPMLVLGIAALAWGCAAYDVARVSPERIPELEQRLATGAGDPELQLALGEAYYNASRYADARAVLERVVEVEADNDEARLFLGFALDELEDYEAARAHYGELLEQRPDPAVVRIVEERLVLLDRKEALAAARDALVREAELTANPPRSNAVAVLPVIYTGSNTDLEPLERGLAAIFVSDLGAVSRLTVVERLHVQALIDEMRLSRAGLTSAATAARSGRLVRAANVVQATLADAAGGDLRLDASLVVASTSRVVGRSSHTDRLEGLLRMQKQAVLDIIDLMGVELTPAEHDRITELPTENILAFLQFSNGLRQQDRGEFAAAEASFRQATQLDPAFRQAEQAADLSSQLSTAQGASPMQVVGRTQGSAARAAARTRLLSAVARLTPTAADVLAQPAAGAGGTKDNERKGIQEGTDRQGPTDATRTSIILIIVKRP